jgi:MFS family permease
VTSAVSQSNIRWNFWTLGPDIAFFSLGISVSSVYTIMPLFVSHLTPDNWPVALIVTARMLGLYLPQPFVATYIERLQRVKPFLLIATLFERLPFVGLAIATLLLAHGHNELLLFLFFALIILQTGGAGLSGVAWVDLISRCFPFTMQGRFLGGWSGVGNVAGIGGAALAAALIATLAWPQNFTICFLVTFAMMVISYISFAFGREPPRTEIFITKRPTGFRYWLADMISIVRNDHLFARYLSANALAALATLGSGLLALVGLRQAHLSTDTVSIETTVLMSALTFGSFFWGFVGDRLGPRIVLIGSMAIGTLGTIAALMARDAIQVTLMFVLYGLSLSGTQLASLTYTVRFGPESRRPVYIALTSLLVAPFAAGAPLLGGIMADRWGYTIVFTMATVFGLLAMLAYWCWVRDPEPIL